MIRKNGWLSITQGRARSIRKAVCLVWYREWNNGHDARSCEFYLKRKTKQEKEALAASFGKDTD